VAEQERAVGHDFVVDVRAKYDVAQAMETDDVAQALNYAALYDVVSKVMKEPQALIETVAGRIAKEAFEQFPQIERMEVRIEKINPPIGADMQGAAVELVFSR